MPVVCGSEVCTQLMLPSWKLGVIKVEVTAMQPKGCVFGEQRACKPGLLNFISEPDKHEIIFNRKQPVLAWDVRICSCVILVTFTVYLCSVIICSSLNCVAIIIS